MHKGACCHGWLMFLFAYALHMMLKTCCGDLQYGLIGRKSSRCFDVTPHTEELQGICNHVKIAICIEQLICGQLLRPIIIMHDVQSATTQ